jgi:hypothetical protein
MSQNPSQTSTASRLAYLQSLESKANSAQGALAALEEQFGTTSMGAGVNAINLNEGTAFERGSLVNSPVTKSPLAGTGVGVSPTIMERRHSKASSTLPPALGHGPIGGDSGSTSVASSRPGTSGGAGLRWCPMG